MSGGLVQSLPSLAVNRTPAAPAMSRRSGIDRTVPFRWALTGARTAVTPSAEAPAAQLWFLPELVICAALVLARSGGGELVFVGRSLDSVADLLDAALESVPASTRPRVHRLPLSFRPQWGSRDGLPTRVPITPAQRAHLRDALRDVGAAPTQLARKGRPVTFVDVVHSGETFTELFAHLVDWVQQQQVPWPIVRRRLRFRRRHLPNAVQPEDGALASGCRLDRSAARRGDPQRLTRHAGVVLPRQHPTESGPQLPERPVGSTGARAVPFDGGGDRTRRGAGDRRLRSRPRASGHRPSHPRRAGPTPAVAARPGHPVESRTASDRLSHNSGRQSRSAP